jgi:hypothetical protein
LEGECLNIPRDGNRSIGIWRKEILVRRNGDNSPFKLPSLYFDYFEIVPVKS